MKIAITLFAWFQPVAEQPVQLTTGGTTIMVSSIGAVLCLMGFCLYRVLSLSEQQSDEIKGPLTIDTLDTQDAD